VQLEFSEKKNSYFHDEVVEKNKVLNAVVVIKVHYIMSMGAQLP
jgi:hypothetical protein